MSHTEGEQSEGVPANISSLRGLSALWLIPIVTLLVGIWMVYDYWASQGPLITIEFTNADGLVEGKTKIKNRSIDVGEVVSIRMNESRDGVLLQARMEPEVRDLLVEGSSFWVVRPSIGLSGVSGLGTIVSGQHIEFSPGTSEARQDHFEGLDKPPLTPPGTPGLHITLNSESDFSYGEGDAILYQGYKVGKIEDIYFNSSERMMYYNAFIEAPYHGLVTHNTRFWDSSGIRAELGSAGISIKTDNLESVLLGGVSFGLPDGVLPGEPVTERAYYRIYSSRSLIAEKSFQHVLNYILLVDNSVPGLKVGDSVLMRGIKVGKVVHSGHIPVGESLLDERLKIPIQIEVNPGRLGMPDTEAGRAQAAGELLQWMSRGMSAAVKSTNPIFNEHIVQLILPENPIDTELMYYEEMPVIAVSSDGFGEITAKITRLVDEISSLPIQDIGINLDQLLSETTVTMRRIQELAVTGDKVLAEAGEEELVSSLNNTVVKLGELAASYSTSSPTNKEIRLLMENLTYVLAELGPLLTELKNRPNGLIFSGRRAPEPEPERSQN